MCLYIEKCWFQPLSPIYDIWSEAQWIFLQQPVILSMFSVTDKKRSVTTAGGDTGETLEMEWSSSLREDTPSTAAISALSNGTVPKPECEATA